MVSTISDSPKDQLARSTSTPSTDHTVDAHTYRVPGEQSQVLTTRGRRQ